MGQFTDSAGLAAKVNSNMQQAIHLSDVLTNIINAAAADPITMSAMIEAHNAAASLRTMFQFIVDNTNVQSYLAGLMGYTTTQIATGAANIISAIDTAETTMRTDLPGHIDTNGDFWWDFVGPDTVNGGQKVRTASVAETATTRAALQAIVDAM